MKSLLLSCTSIAMALFYSSQVAEAKTLKEGEPVQYPQVLKIEELLEILETFPTGKQLVEQSRSRWGLSGNKELSSMIQMGQISRTDAVLSREYDANGEGMRQTRQVSVTINSNQPFEEILLDLAHELVHATFGPAWDPYDPKLNASRYIRASIEGRGGEVSALVVECQVAQELQRKYEILVPRCTKYFDESRKRILRTLVTQEFYKVGTWKKTILETLGDNPSDLPQLSSQEASLFSSTGNAPYPVALLREYVAVNEAACRNSFRRLAELRTSQASPQKGEIERKISTFLSKRCMNGKSF